jgi:hypothetical protein
MSEEYASAAAAEAEVLDAIAVYLKDPASLGLTTDLAVLARTLNALPVYADVGGALLIRPSGEVLEVGSDQSWASASLDFSVVVDPKWISLAYDKCALRYPSLRHTIMRFRPDARSDI